MTLDLDALPVRMDRRAAAALISQHFFTVAARSLERWPLDEVYVNGKVMLATRQLVAEAARRLALASTAPDPRKRGHATESSAAQN